MKGKVQGLKNRVLVLGVSRGLVALLYYSPQPRILLGVSLVIDLTIDSRQVGWVLITLHSQFIAIATQSSVASLSTMVLTEKWPIPNFDALWVWDQSGGLTWPVLSITSLCFPGFDSSWLHYSSWCTLWPCSSVAGSVLPPSLCGSSTWGLLTKGHDWEGKRCKG